MLLQWIVSWLARSQGWLDPMATFAQLRRFGRPSEALLPTELLRVGMVLHARGLMNTQAIQHNLDWVWPYWVVKQFNPHDPSFVPRAFSLTHINLTHRNWTAIGVPDHTELPIVDPRGLVTPMLNGWSLESWLVTTQRALIPSQQPEAVQERVWDHGPAVRTTVSADGLSLVSVADVTLEDGQAMCRLRAVGHSREPARLIIALRPYNPEGVSFIRQIALRRDPAGWLVNKREEVRWSETPDRMVYSRYATGDVFHLLSLEEGIESIECDVGLATAAAVFRVPAGGQREITVQVPLPAHDTAPKASAGRSADERWRAALDGACQLQIPDPHWQFLYDTALRSVILHAPEDVYPGPYTYKRFWFRDATFILHAMVCVGLVERAERVLDRFATRQTPGGYFRSQQGEWDSNGQALWIFHRFGELTGRLPKPAWRGPIRRAAQWIQRKRVPKTGDELHAGLLPAGFSAEHFGPNDYYYWDDFWSVAGLRAAGAMLHAYGDVRDAARCRWEAEDLMACVERSLARVEQRLRSPTMPASPYRRMDAGTIGTLAAGYPLQLWPADDRRLKATAEFLLEQCLVNGAFYQTMSHSGINPYLTLHIAQVLLRMGNARALELLRTIGQLASPTGEWPEAVHPRTLGGCMGDGQHVWASAEWLMMIRHCFVREEEQALVIGAGLPAEWCRQGEPLRFGPAPTSHGTITVTVIPHPEHPTVSCEGRWRGEPPTLHMRVPGFQAVTLRGETSVQLDGGVT